MFFRHDMGGIQAAALVSAQPDIDATDLAMMAIYARFHQVV